VGGGGGGATPFEGLSLAAAAAVRVVGVTIFWRLAGTLSGATTVYVP
jgi:hypothetical protein